MLIDPFKADWVLELTRRHAALPEGACLVLLIDGAFVPGLFRKLGNGCKPILLFESLPGCSDAARDVSPFVTPFDPADKTLVRVLEACNGWPMVSAVVTFETAAQFAARLAAWCIVEVDGQRFNFRFPDTRRLPGIFDVLTVQQRAEFVGGAMSWHYIGRDGAWGSLALEPLLQAAPITAYARLDDSQFARLVKDGDADGVWVQLQDRGVQSDLSPSQRHALLSAALNAADKHGLDESLTLSWCGECMRAPDERNADTWQIKIANWTEENIRRNDEALYRTA